MTSIITGGTISVEDCKKHDGYPDPQFAPTRKVRVELTFSVPADAEDGSVYMDQTAHLANLKVAELLGNKAPVAKTERTPAEIAAADALKLASAGTPAAPKVPPATRKPGRPPAAVAAVKGVIEAANTDMVDALDEGGAEAGDGLDDLLGDAAEPAKEVTDAELNAAVRKKNEALKAPAKIRDLIATYGTADKKITLAEIPQPKRQEFLAKLEALA